MPESVFDFLTSGLFAGSFASGETLLFQAATLVADGALLGLWLSRFFFFNGFIDSSSNPSFNDT